ncbi:DegT/DnrJ/EryC1/StrS family aminotransferase, partial [Streptomyces sp. NPDC002078]
MNQIPLVDLKAAHEEVADEVRAGFERILAGTAFIGGDEVRQFEREYADFGDVAHCVGVANGTDAVELALRTSGVGPGDEVVIPANTFIATAGAVARTGARPVLADCLPDTYLLDPQAALDAIGPATRAVVPVHLYGQMADVTALSGRLPDRIHVVEDAAQCQGATRDGHTPGSGGIAATSFYPGKNLGAYGDAGAVLTDDEELAGQVRAIANHGGVAKYRHDVPGFNSRLDGLQAVVLRAKLARLADGNAARRAAAARYHALLAD